jgi:hypothetical protein
LDNDKMPRYDPRTWSTRRQFVAGGLTALLGLDSIREVTNTAERFPTPINGAQWAINGFGEELEDLQEPGPETSVDSLSEFNRKALDYLGEDGSESVLEEYRSTRDEVIRANPHLDWENRFVEEADTFVEEKYGVFSSIEEEIDNVEDGGVHFSNEQGDWIAVSDVTETIESAGPVDETENAFLALRAGEQYDESELRQVARGLEGEYGGFHHLGEAAEGKANILDNLADEGASEIQAHDTDVEDEEKQANYQTAKRENYVGRLRKDADTLEQLGSHYNSVERLVNRTLQNSNLEDGEVYGQSREPSPDSTDTPEPTETPSDPQEEFPNLDYTDEELEKLAEDYPDREGQIREITALKGNNVDIDDNPRTGEFYAKTSPTESTQISQEMYEFLREHE